MKQHYLALNCLILESKMLYRLNVEKLKIEIHASDDYYQKAYGRSLEGIDSVSRDEIS